MVPLAFGTNYMCDFRQGHGTSVALGFSPIKKERDLITSKVSVPQNNSKRYKSQNLKHTSEVLIAFTHSSDRHVTGDPEKADMPAHRAAPSPAADSAACCTAGSCCPAAC